MNGWQSHSDSPNKFIGKRFRKLRRRIGSGIKVDPDFTYRSDNNLKWMKISELQLWIEQNKDKIGRV